MPAQVTYYDEFAALHKNSILACPCPEWWTTDYESKGRIYSEIKERVNRQQQLIHSHFNKLNPVLDIGCGFGRQAIWLASEGYPVTGTDTSNGLLDIARKLFENKGLGGDFHCINLLESTSPLTSYSQVLLLDVFEHIPPGKRRYLFEQIFSVTAKNGILILSVPHVRERISSWINNRVRRAITQHLSYFRNREEHPYPVPGKRKVLSLAKDLFTLREFHQSKDTLYFIFQR